MSVVFHENSMTFHLFNRKVSYVIYVMANGQLGQLYYGKALRDRDNFNHLMESTCRPISSWPMKEHPELSMEFSRQEYPSFGTSDYRQPAFEIMQENGSHISNFEYASYEIVKGKPGLKELPASYVESDEEAETLIITMKDALTGLVLYLSYTIYADRPIITRNVRFVNEGAQVLKLTRALSMSVDFSDCNFVWKQFSGAWSRERHPYDRTLEPGITSIESMRGHSSATQNPFVILMRPETTEACGEAYSFSFVYSGNFLAQAEADTFGALRFSMGINPRNFTWKLAPGVEFQTPEVIMNYSAEGLNDLSNNLHSLLRERVARGPWRDKERPVLLNNWEATGMEFTEESILKIAGKGAEVGCELFVLDDGWFGKRTEFSGLGDWFIDKSKLPNGVKGLADKVNALGMNFGIWIEPEMVNEDSELFRAHPEYVLCTPDRRMSLGRNQLVLDYSNPEVIDCIFDQLMESLGQANISYIKWDMNRSITECYSRHWPADQQGEVYHRYILGVYRLYEKLLAAFPGILIESCASGGSRFDAGILYYAPQAWCSDDTDAVERIRIQYGSSYGYPISSWGAHVSECPNQQLGRNTPLETRANVAYFGAFGYEMDLNALNEKEIEDVKRQISFMKANRKLIQFGSFYRLINPYENQIGAWMVVSEDKKDAIVGYYKLMNTVNTGFVHVKLQGLDPELDYVIEGRDTVYGGDELMAYGVPTLDDPATNPLARSFDTHQDVCMDLDCDYGSRLFVLHAE